MSTSGLNYDDKWLYPDEPWREIVAELWPNGDRLKVAWHLSPTINVCEDLLKGHYVDPSRLDQDWLRWAKREQFVALKPALEVL